MGSDGLRKMTGKHPKRPRDFSQAAKLVIDIASGECRDTWQEREGPMLNSIELPEHTQRNLFGFQAN
jgi:hypothetical protein